ncbi:nuclear pore membrane glycoprotein 210-like [Rhopilema esculentum]|uniref:nuclear pore membrane glycoprotein 210-like n=1 Tax=Rhopilema esculentum TaxID=499914 RepID=UPI0031CE7A3E
MAGFGNGCPTTLKLWAMMEASFLILQVLTIFCGSANSYTPENSLNVPQLLLPNAATNTIPTNYTLRAMKGCLHWSSSKPDIAKVIQLPDKDSCPTDRIFSQSNVETDRNGCSRSALVIVTSTSKEKETAIITAEDESTGIMLRCDVFVDTIHRIEIATTTRELLLGEAPEVFDVYGYDEEGNLFSSLGSTVFEWHLSPSTVSEVVDPATVLRFLQFQDTSYDTEPEIQILEEKGLQGSSVIMEGINTGEAFVSAKLAHAEYKHVSPSTVKLMVIDNIVLQPSKDMYILIGTKVFYKVKQLRRGHAKEIQMPSSQYRLQLDKDEIAELNHADSSITGLRLGSVKVLLIDNNVAHTKSLRQPSATIHVVEPESLGFAIAPGNSWVLQTGKEYVINVEVFDAQKHKILITDNTVMTSMLEEEFVGMKFKSANNSYHRIKALKKGKTVVNATLYGVKAENGTEIKLKKPIFGEKIIEIFDEIKVEPSLVIFPWDPNAESIYNIQLKATGGSGAYQWASQNYSVCTVTNKGLAKTEGPLGTSVIKASDKRNNMHFGLSKVFVLPPEEMHFIATKVEAEIGQVLELPLSVSAYVNVDGKRILKTFQDCRKLSLAKSLSVESVFAIDRIDESRSSQEGSCLVIKLKALKSGFATLTVSHDANGVVIKASITVGAYSPLVVVHPKDFASVTLGSSEIVTLAGGPRPWILDSSGFYEYLSAEEDEFVSIQPLKQTDVSAFKEKADDVHYFQVTCKQLTEMQILSGQVGNKPTAKNQYPASAITELRFLCSPPGSLSLQPDILLPVIAGQQMTLETCKDTNKLIPVLNKRELVILLMVRDQNGQIFANASSLDIVWTSSDRNLAEISQQTSLSYSIKSNTTVSATQMVVLSGKTGPVVINAKVSGYREVALYAIGYYEDDAKAKINPPIVGSLGLLLVNERVIVPQSLVIFAHPENKAHLKMKYGSHHHRVRSNGDHFASIQNMNSELTITPRAPGKLVLMVDDVCLDAEAPATAHITLADIFSLHVVVADKVGLHETIKAIVQIKDSEGNFLSFNSMKLMTLTPKFSHDLIKIKADDPETDGVFSDKAIFTLEGTAVGVTSLTFDATKANKIRIASKPKDIQVFPPLELEPKHIVLIAGATFQVHSTGGPRPESTTVFDVANASVANVSSTGIIHALTPGNTTLVGMAQGFDPSTGKQIIYSKAYVTIEVVRLTGFKIHLTTRILATGSQVGMYAVGLTDQGPFTFASSHPFIKFHWSCGNNDIAVLKSVYELTGLTTENERDFRVTLSTKKAGETIVRLKVDLPVLHAEKIALPHAVLEDEIQIQVYEGLKVVFPENGRLLLPPNAETRIETNKNGLTRLSYDVIKECPSPKTAAGVVEVSQDGIIKTTSSSGMALVKITSHEDFGLNETAIINVEVKAVSSITLKSLSSLTASRDNFHSFPVGYRADFVVTLHDNVGRKFDALTSQLRHRLQRNDISNVLPDVSKGIYTITAVKVGFTIFKIWDENNADVADYIRIRAANAIQPPQASVYQGGMVCFKSTVNAPKGSSVTWSSSNIDVIDINAKTGYGFAKSPGIATIYANHGNFVTHVEVNAQKTTSVELIQGKIGFISNFGKKVYDFPIAVKGSGRSSINLCSNSLVYDHASKIPFTCTLSTIDEGVPVSLDTLFSVTSKYVNGEPFCEVVPNELNRRDMKLLSAKETKLLLQASLTGEEPLATSLKLRFIPAFHINKKEIELSSSNPQDVITINGVESHLNTLKVHSSLSNVVHILPLDRELGESRVEYQLSLVRKSDLPANEVYFVIESSVTGQREEILVGIKVGKKVEQPQCIPQAASTVDEGSISGEKQSIFYEQRLWMIWYTIIIATVILLICVYHNWMTRRQYRSTHALSPAFHSAPPPYQVVPGHGSPFQTWTPTHTHDSPHSPPSERRPHSAYKDPLKTTPGNRTLFSVGQ